jgi:predicted DNA-binding transcriptional regulator AlpA
MSSVLLDIREVARRLNVSTRHIATLEKRGLIPPAIRVGRCLRWDPRRIEDFIGGRPPEDGAAVSGRVS